MKNTIQGRITFKNGFLFCLVVWTKRFDGYKNKCGYYFLQGNRENWNGKTNDRSINYFVINAENMVIICHNLLNRLIKLKSNSDTLEINRKQKHVDLKINQNVVNKY